MKNFLFLGSIGWGEIIVLAILIILLFGGKKIPELMRGLGKGVKEFKSGMKDVEKDVNEIRKDLESDSPKEEKK